MQIPFYPTDITIAPVTAKDDQQVMDLFNHYVEHSFAAYPENRLPCEAFGQFLDMGRGYPFVTAKEQSGKLLGFALLRPYHPMPTFAHTAEISCFIGPEHTGKGIGSRLLKHLEEEARGKGIKIILAGISSLNPGSIAFHRRHGFRECGRFHRICRKKERYFDVVWMEKELA